MTAPRNTWDDGEDDLSFTERMDRLYGWNFAEPPVGSVEESVREDAKWERDDEPPEDED